MEKQIDLKKEFKCEKICEHIEDFIEENSDFSVGLFIATLDSWGYARDEALDIEDALEKFIDGYHGGYESRMHWAGEVMENCYNLKNMPQIFQLYFDYELFIRDSEMDGSTHFVFYNGELHVFSMN